MRFPAIALLLTVCACTIGAASLCEEPPSAGRPVKTVLLLSDGSRIVGQMEAGTLAVDTAFGRLEVPVDQVLRLRVARCSDAATRREIAALVRDLSSQEFATRERATVELRKRGDAAAGMLREAAESADPEVRSRAGKLLDEYEAAHPETLAEENVEAPLLGEEDELVTRRFTARGRLEAATFAVKTEYGDLRIPRSKVVFASLGTPRTISRDFTLAGENTVHKPVATGIRVSPGDCIKFAASGSIYFEDEEETCTPAGNTDWWGQEVAGHPGNALIGRIGNGPYFLVGESATVRVTRSGPLQLCLAYSGSVGGAQGKYEAKVVVERP